MKYDIGKENEILIYGAGGLGRSMCKKLLEQGFRVLGYIDKNANIICENSVYSIDESITRVSGKIDRVTVIICIHNALLHSDIAEELYHAGYNNILFIPFDEKFNIKHRRTMEERYSYFADEIYDNLYDIPQYSTMLKYSLSINDGVISRNQNKITVWMDISSIYTNVELKKRGNEQTQKYGGVVIPALRPYINMFKYCASGYGDIEEYCIAFKSVQNTLDIMDKMEFINDRLKLFKKLRAELDKGMEYFINSAAELKWDDEKHLFSVVEGHHRLIFLYLQHHRIVPVKISNSDFEKWVNKELFNKIKNLFLEKQIIKWHTPLNHPGFYYLSSEFEIIAPTVLNMLYEDSDIVFKRKGTMADLSLLGGYYARALYLLGYSNAYCLCVDENEREIIEGINATLYCENIVLAASLKSEIMIRSYDTIVISLVNLRYRGIMVEIQDLLDWNVKEIIVEVDEGYEVKKYVESRDKTNLKYIRKCVNESGVTDIWLIQFL